MAGSATPCAARCGHHSAGPGGEDKGQPFALCSDGLRCQRRNWKKMTGGRLQPFNRRAKTNEPRSGEALLAHVEEFLAPALLQLRPAVEQQLAQALLQL